MYALEDLEKTEELGKGTYGRVFKVRDRRNDDTFALKVIPFAGDDDGVPSSALREIAILKDFQNEHIVRLIDVIHSQTSLCLLFEYCAYDLNKFISSRPNRLTAFEIKILMKQLLGAVAFLHANRIIHRDLKPENILLTKNGTIKLADFGLAIHVGIQIRSLSTEVVTLWYRAPEILLGAKVYDCSIDLWSVGCIFAEMVNNGSALFPGTDVFNQLEKIFSIVGTPTDESWPGVSSLPNFESFVAVSKCNKYSVLSSKVPTLNAHGVNLLSGLLTCAPCYRIHIDEALKHQFFFK